MDAILKRLPELRDRLSKVDTTYSYDKVYIGEAITMLSLLEDIINAEKTREIII